MDRPLTPDADGAATDHDALERLRRFGGDKLLREMIALFVASVPERLASARDGVRRGDAPVVERALHSLKSSSAQLGAMKMQAISERGEHRARAGALNEILPIVDELAQEYRRVHAWLDAACDGQGDAA